MAVGQDLVAVAEPAQAVVVKPTSTGNELTLAKADSLDFLFFNEFLIQSNDTYVYPIMGNRTIEQCEDSPSGGIGT